MTQEAGIGRNLSHAPLERVVCQARWQQLTRLADGDVTEVAANLAKVLAADYPFTHQQQEMQVTITPSGVSQTEGGTVVKYESADHQWSVSLSTLFVAFETVCYPGHEQFIQRFNKLMDALLGVLDIPSVNRLGYRYTNRFTSADDMDNLSRWFSQSVLDGLVGDNRDAIVQTICETLYRDDDRYLMVRSALVPAGAVVDPVLPAVDEQSWVLDLDAYTETSVSPRDGVDTAVRALSALASGRFAKLLTPEGLGRFQ